MITVADNGDGKKAKVEQELDLFWDTLSWKTIVPLGIELANIPQVEIESS